MPSRVVILTIVAFWLATSGWWFTRDLLPRLQSDEPPSFALSLVDEAPRRPFMNPFWGVAQLVPGEQPDQLVARPVGRAGSRVKYDRLDGVYDLWSKLEFFPRQRGEQLGSVGAGLRPLGARAAEGENEGRAGVRTEWPVVITSIYRITREGELRELNTEIVTRQHQDSILELKGLIDADLQGSVQDQHFSAHWWLRTDEGTGHDQDLEPVPVSQNGVVLNALQPVQRLSGLYVGQRWRVPLVDPLAACQPGKRPEIPIVEARVSEATLSWNARKVNCFVVDYQGRDYHIRSWVRKTDDLILQQEAGLPGLRLLFTRYTDR